MATRGVSELEAALPSGDDISELKSDLCAVWGTALKLNPFRVQPRRCWALAIPTSVILVAGVMVYVAFFIMANITLLSKPSVALSTSATFPPLPYIYLCPNQAPYTLSAPVYVGCADNISDATLSVTPNRNGGSTRAGASCQQMDIVTVEIMDRNEGGPVDVQCVVFQYLTLGEDVPWNTQLYLMLPSADFADGYSASTLQVTPIGLNAYLSVYGPGAGGKYELSANHGFLRNFEAINSSVNPLNKFEEGAVFLPANMWSAFQVQKQTRRFQVTSPKSLQQFVHGSAPVIQFVEVGSSTNAPLPDLVPGLASLHNLPGNGSGFGAVAASVSITFDEVEVTESNQIGYILLVAGVIPGCLGWAVTIWGYIFAPFPKAGSVKAPPPEYFVGWARRPVTEKKEGKEGGGLYKRGDWDSPPDQVML